MANKISKRRRAEQIGITRNKVVTLLFCLLVVSTAACFVQWMHARKLLASPTFAVINFENPVSTYSHKSTSFTVDVKSARAASAILRDARSLPLSQGGACPADSGAMYNMIFVHQDVVVTADPTGCQMVKISGLSGVYRADARFWQDVHQVSGKPILPGSSARYY